MINKIVTVVILVLIGSCITLHSKVRDLSTKYDIAVNNVKAYETELSLEHGNNRVFKLTINQLINSRDSLVDKLRKVKDELNIKDSRLQQLQYSLLHVSKKDTVYFRDTIFSSPEFTKDTIIGDKWVEIRLHLQYPDMIIVNPEIELENYLFLTQKKETIQPPRKFFIWRWFQKKHTIVEIVIKEENPYVKNKEHRFIQIIK